METRNIQYLTLFPRPEEKLSLRLWFEELGSFLKTNPNDNELRGKLSKDNPHGLWNKRPKDLKELDYIFQEYPHSENVGDHSYHVAMNLDTQDSYNEKNYLENKPNMIKVIRSVAILHDIGKRKNPANEKHSYESAQEVEQYLKWMDFNDKEVQLCLHLINHHDILGKVINPNAKETIDDILKICSGSPAILQCFWIFTIADVGSIKGIMENIPNTVKNITQITRAVDYKLKKTREKRLYSLPK